MNDRIEKESSVDMEREELRLCTLLDISPLASETEIRRIYSDTREKIEQTEARDELERQLLREKRCKLEDAFEAWNDYVSHAQWPASEGALPAQGEKKNVKMYSFLPFHIPCVIWLFSKIGDCISYLFVDCVCGICPCVSTSSVSDSQCSDIYYDGVVGQTIDTLGAILVPIACILCIIFSGKNSSEPPSPEKLKKLQKEFEQKSEKLYEKYESYLPFTQYTMNFLNKVDALDCADAKTDRAYAKMLEQLRTGSVRTWEVQYRTFEQERQKLRKKYNDTDTDYDFREVSDKNKRAALFMMYHIEGGFHE